MWKREEHRCLRLPPAACAVLGWRSSSRRGECGVAEKRSTEADFFGLMLLRKPASRMWRETVVGRIS
jgi:hypothetical protein